MSGDEQLSLKKYVGRTCEGQEDIFYISDESIDVKFSLDMSWDLLNLRDDADKEVVRVLEQSEGQVLRRCRVQFR